MVAEGNQILGIIHLKDVVKGGISERFERFRAMGIRTVMITGDNPRTAAAIARKRVSMISSRKRHRKRKCGSSEKNKPKVSWSP